MFKLIKYEIIGKYKVLSILAIVTLILNLALVFQMRNWPVPACLALSILLATGMYVILLVWCISMFSKDIYEDTGYLTYILPQRGYSIVAAKLIVSFIYFIIAAIVSGLFIRFFFISISELTTGLDAAGIKVNSWGLVIGIILLYGFDFIKLLITVYFSIAITRIAIAKKRAGKFIAFVVFIIINVCEGFLNYYLALLFPQQVHLKIVEGVSGVVSTQSNGMEILTKGIPVNISTTVLSVLLFIAFYIATSYVVENKIDL